MYLNIYEGIDMYLKSLINMLRHSTFSHCFLNDGRKTVSNSSSSARQESKFSIVIFTLLQNCHAYFNW